MSRTKTKKIRDRLDRGVGTPGMSQHLGDRQNKSLKTLIRKHKVIRVGHK